MDALTFPAGMSLAPGMHLMLVPDPAPSASAGSVALVDPAWLLARNPELAKTASRSLVRFPDGADTDVLCEDFHLSEHPTPGLPNSLD